MPVGDIDLRSMQMPFSQTSCSKPTRGRRIGAASRRFGARGDDKKEATAGVFPKRYDVPKPPPVPRTYDRTTKTKDPPVTDPLWLRYVSMRNARQAFLERSPPLRFARAWRARQTWAQPSTRRSTATSRRRRRGRAKQKRCTAQAPGTGGVAAPIAMKKVRSYFAMPTAASAPLVRPNALECNLYISMQRG